MSPFSEKVVDAGLTPIPGLSVTVRTRAGILASLYTADATPLAQPLVTDQFGVFSFYANDNAFDIEYRQGGVIVRQDRVVVGEIDEGGAGGDLRADLAAAGGVALVNGAVSTSANTAALASKVDLLPSPAFSSLPDAADVLYAQFLNLWWDGTNHRLRPTDGGGINNGRPNPGLSVPSMWQALEGVNLMYEQWKRKTAAGDTVAASDAATKIGQEWTYLKSVFSAADLKLGIGVTQNISDDGAWMIYGYCQIHEVTGDALALAYAIEQLAGTSNAYHDPLQAATSLGYTTPGGIIFKVDPLGMLYARATDTAGIATYGYVSTSYQTYMALAATYIYRQNNIAAFLNFATISYSWLFTYLRSPAPANSTKAAQGIYATGFNLDPNVANGASLRGFAEPSEVYHTAQQAYFGKPIRAISRDYDGGTVAMACLAEDLYELTGTAAYLAEAKSIAAAYPLQNAFGRMQRGVPLLGSLRDPWTNGHAFARFARTVLTRNDVDPTNAMRIALRNTGKSIIAQASVEGYLSADWGGPEFDFATGHETWAEESYTGYGGSPGGGAAAPDQIMTHATTLTTLFGAAAVSPAVSLGSGAATRLAVDDMPAEIAALWLGVRSKADVSGQRFTGPIRLDQQYYMTLYDGKPFWNADSNDYFLYDRSLNLWQWSIGSAEKLRIDTAGLSIYGSVSIYGNALPDVDNSHTVGSPSLRWSTIYAATGTINTSDERDKTWRGALTSNELAAAREIGGIIGIYQWNDAIAEKGADGARWHTGVKAQQVVSVMTAHGLTPMRYGFVCYDVWTDIAGEAPTTASPGKPASPGRAPIAAGNRFGIRPDELHAFLIAGQEQRIRALEDA